MKKFISGFLVGAMLFGAIGAFAVSYVANPLDYKVMVNGEEFVSDPPALEVEGRTYLPLRAMGDALGVPVNWNEELRQAEVGTVSSATTISGYKTYEENASVIDFGDFCGVEPCSDKVIEEDWIDYTYDFKTVDKLADYMEVMIENGYKVVSEEKESTWSMYVFRNIDNIEAKSFIISFGQLDSSSLNMNVRISLIK